MGSEGQEDFMVEGCIRLGNSKLRKIMGGLLDCGCRLESVQGEGLEDYERGCIRLDNSKLREIMGGLLDCGCRLESVQGEGLGDYERVCIGLDITIRESASCDP